MPLFKGGIFASGGFMDWAFNYIAWKPYKLILFGCYKDYDYCEEETRKCISIVDRFLIRMMYGQDDR